jgi:ABC-type polar amino acid transport system ATPase subunit
MLKINNVSKIIKGKAILKDISLTALPGEVTFLLGESGTGKSTLLRVLNGLEKYHSGTITVDDKIVDASNVHTLVKLVFQHFNLFPHLTVQENITLALKHVLHKASQEANHSAQELLKKYKLIDKANSSIKSLSGGQQQRLAIARAEATNPYIICLDEPTSALDPFLTSHVAKQIQELANEGRIVLVATHDMNLVLSNNIHGMIHLMHQGEIIETASTEEIKSDAKKLKKLLPFIKGALPEF